MIRYRTVHYRPEGFDPDGSLYLVSNYGQYIGMVYRPTRQWANARGLRHEWKWTDQTTHSSWAELRNWNSIGTGRDASRTTATVALLQHLELFESADRLMNNRSTRRASSRGTRGNGRAFGVEMELTGPSRSVIINALQQRGISVRNVNGYRGSNGSMWELKYDGSVSGEHLELVSPKLRGTAGLEVLETVCEALNSVGATVNRTCGLHVHHDFRGMTLEQIKRQTLAFLERQALIERMVQPSRRGQSNHYCPSWSPTQIATLRQTTSLGQVAYVGPRGNLNLQAYARHGSVEIRWHGGSTNFRKIAAWIRLGQAIFAAAEAGVDLPTDTPENLLGALRSFTDEFTVTDSATVLRFERMGQTREQVEAALAEAQEMLEEVAS